jgi:DNA-binding CsgD family transcriptional regulator
VNEPNLELPAALAQSLSERHVVLRPAALDALRDAAASAAQAGGLLALSGEPGVGKTRLSAELAAEVARERGAVLYGRCGPGPAAPYEPFLQALEHPVAIRAAQRLSDDLRSRLSPLVPGLGRLPDHVARIADHELERLRMFEAVLAVLRAISVRRRTLVVLEDLHWGSPSTLALLDYLASRSPRGRLTLLGTLRAPDPDRGRAVHVALGDLRRRNALYEMALAGLSAEETAALITDWAGTTPSAQFVADLHAYTGGNPFYLRSTLRHLSSAGLLLSDDRETRDRLRDKEGRLPVPNDVHDLAVSLIHRLGAPASTLLQAAAVLGSEFALDEAAAAAELSVEETVDALDVATEAGVVRQRAGSVVRVTFEHALIQQALREAMTPARRALVSLRAAEAIEAAGAPATRSAELAMRFAEAMSLGTASRTLKYARKAAEEAGRRYAFEEQAENLELAARAIEAGAASSASEKYDIQMALGTARYRGAQLDRSHAAFVRAADLAERGGDQMRLARAALGVGLERYLHRAGAADMGTIALLERGLAAMDGRDDVLRARLITAWVLERFFIDGLEYRRQQIDEAIVLAHRLGDADAEIEARTVRQVVLWYPTYTRELLDEAPRLVRDAHRRGRGDLAMHLHSTAVGQALELAHRPAFDEHFAGAMRVAEGLRTPIQQVRAEALRVLAALVLGRLDEATSAIDAVLPSMTEIEPETAAQLGLLWQLMLARQRGSLADMHPHLAALVSAAPGIPLLRGFLGEAYAEAGEVALARVQLDLLAAHEFEDLHEDFLWLAVLSATGRLAARVGDTRRVRVLYDKLAPYADCYSLSGVATAGPPVAFTLGLLAASLGELERAMNHLTSGRARARDFGARPWEAQAALALGRVLRRAGSRRAAREPLAAALRLAESYGAEPLAAQAREELLAVGGRPLRRPERPRLTESELRVAQLAAQGRTNEQIAQAVFVSRRTVETHLTHAYRKLGIKSRTELGEALAAHDALTEP